MTTDIIPLNVKHYDPILIKELRKVIRIFILILIVSYKDRFIVPVLRLDKLDMHRK